MILTPIEPPEEPIEPLPENIPAAEAMAERRAAHFLRNYGSMKCHNCPNDKLSFAEPWAHCTDCDWIEGY